MAKIAKFIIAAIFIIIIAAGGLNDMFSYSGPDGEYGIVDKFLFEDYIIDNTKSNDDINNRMAAASCGKAIDMLNTYNDQLILDSKFTVNRLTTIRYLNIGINSANQVSDAYLHNESIPNFDRYYKEYFIHSMILMKEGLTIQDDVKVQDGIDEYNKWMIFIQEEAQRLKIR